MKVKASNLFKDYRRIVLDIDKKTFRSLQAGYEAEIFEEVYNKNSSAFKIIKVEEIKEKSKNARRSISK